MDNAENPVAADVANTSPPTTDTGAFDVAAHGLQGVLLETTDHVEQGRLKAAVKGADKRLGAIMVARTRLKIAPGFNVRAKTPDYQAHVERIGRSMWADGWLASKPVEAFVDPAGDLVVTDGHSRLAAFDWARENLGAFQDTDGQAVIPVEVVEGRTMADMTVGLVKQNQGRPLSPIEVAVVCKRLKAWGWDNAKIAERLDLSLAYVGELLGLINAPESLVKAVQDGLVAASTATDAIKSLGSKEAAKAITEAAKSKKGAKVVPSDIGLSKAQKAVKAAEKKAGTPPISRTMPKVDAITIAECLKALRLVKADPAHEHLGQDTLKAVKALVG